MTRHPEEVHRFIAENVQGTTTRDLTEMVNAKFGTQFTEAKMKSYKCNRKLKSGTPLGVPAGRATNKYPEEIQNFIKDNHAGVGPKDMMELLNKKFGTNYTVKQIKAYYGNHGISSEVTGYFPKGHIPSNKGRKGYCPPGSEKGWFHKGNIPANHKPVGSERIDVEGYTLVKTAEPNKWRFKHKLLWEAENGEVPEGCLVTFLDGNRGNITLGNLELITMAESLQLTRTKLRSSNPEYTKSGILIAKVNIARFNRKKAGA